MSLSGSLRSFLSFMMLLSASTLLYAQAVDKKISNENFEANILHLDSLFWKAYNSCDVNTLQTFFTADVEFYHDKGGLTTTKNELVMTIKSGLCNNTDFRLRREAVKGSIQLFPLQKSNATYGAILSGQHVFYINETGKPETLDGLARFTHVWLYTDGQWKMSRILSYDHGPAPNH
ncbi:MAG: nuclear transport factor 2 family protein [Cyclobacteriaceae bacterium]|nr:nuclear transport factor 2 family protein [Cyclobacteriaceae bacterium]